MVRCGKAHMCMHCTFVTSWTCIGPIAEGVQGPQGLQLSCVDLSSGVSKERGPQEGGDIVNVRGSDGNKLGQGLSDGSLTRRQGCTRLLAKRSPRPSTGRGIGQKSPCVRSRARRICSSTNTTKCFLCRLEALLHDYYSRRTLVGAF